MIEGGLDSRAYVQSHSLIALDAEETLSKFLVDDRPDRDLFNAVIGPIIKQSVARRSPERSEAAKTKLY